MTTMTMPEPAFVLEAADWTRHAGEIYMIRRAVFVVEQGVPDDLELDEFDPGCWHLLARDPAGQPIATGRLLSDGHLGRLAVLAAWRGRGVGRAVVNRLIDQAERLGMPEIVLHAQTHAVDFYRRLGFQTEGDEFMEAGIPHYRMRRRAAAASPGEPAHGR